MLPIISLPTNVREVAIEIDAKYDNILWESVSHHSESGGWSDIGRKESSTVIEGTICKVNAYAQAVGATEGI